MSIRPRVLSPARPARDPEVAAGRWPHRQVATAAGLRCLGGTAALSAILLGGCHADSATGDGTAAALGQAEVAPAVITGPRQYPGFEGYGRPVTTEVANAQRWFDQGIQLLYGFNHDEAIRSFEAAAAADPTCVMAWWGIAFANGLHINNPQMTQVQSERAWRAVESGLAVIDHGAPVEQALMRAVATRYAWPIPDDRAPLDAAYAEAMEALWAAHPNDADIGALFAESLMNLQPWDLYEQDGTPKGRTLEIVAILERTLELRPDHPGANHFYIHAVEASTTPERAVPAADRLVDLVPGSGHLVHMPSHIYARVGRWADASDANARAIEADRRYFSMAPPPEFYALYFVHNLHFLAWSAMMEGRFETAITAARELERDIPEHFLREWTFIADGFMPVSRHVLIRFGRWDDILAEPMPPSYRLFSVAMHHYARTVALAALGRAEEARREQALFTAAADRVPETWAVGNNTAADVLAVAADMAEGEILYREGAFDASFAVLREGIAREDQLRYDEPPGWMQPVRHALGALSMGVGRAADAEAVYRADLERYADNGWSLLGLERALEAQGRRTEAADMARRRAAVWTRADVDPTSSCYCQPHVASAGQ